MGAFTTYAQWCAEQAKPKSGAILMVNSNGAYGGNPPYSSFGRMARRTTALNVYTTGVALTSDRSAHTDAAGALLDSVELPLTGSGELWLQEAELTSSMARTVGTSGARGATTTGLLLDRLVHVGGFSANVAATQTTNLPHPALPRYTTGDGVWAALEVQAALTSSIPQTATISYTNQAGTAGRTSGVVDIGVPATHGASEDMRFFPLAEGDTGVRSIQSVTLSGSTGSTGGVSFGLVLCRPLCLLPTVPSGSGWDRPPIQSTLRGGKVIKIEYGACLMIAWLNATNLTGNLTAVGNLKIAEK